MDEQQQLSNWNHFKAINQARRAVKEFQSIQIPDHDIEEILNEVLRAPSSANAQPYEIHWIKSPGLKNQVAAACNGQRAAQQASTLFVIVSSTGIAKRSLKKYAEHVERSAVLSEKSKAFHNDIINRMGRFLKIAPLAVWTPILGFISLLIPSLSILPFGALGVRHWAAKNSIFAAQNLLLAAVAKGV